jgi:hypothetical protein
MPDLAWLSQLRAQLRLADFPEFPAVPHLRESSRLQNVENEPNGTFWSAAGRAHAMCETNPPLARSSRSQFASRSFRASRNIADSAGSLVEMDTTVR